MPSILLVIMGGTMGAYEEAAYPWLVEEKTFIRRCIDVGSRVVGICLGAQLAAEALGARVYPAAQKEPAGFPSLKPLWLHPILNSSIWRRSRW